LGLGPFFSYGTSFCLFFFPPKKKTGCTDVFSLFIFSDVFYCQQPPGFLFFFLFFFPWVSVLFFPPLFIWGTGFFCIGHNQDDPNCQFWGLFLKGDPPQIFLFPPKTKNPPFWEPFFANPFFLGVAPLPLIRHGAPPLSVGFLVVQVVCFYEGRDFRWVLPMGLDVGVQKRGGFLPATLFSGSF